MNKAESENLGILNDPCMVTVTTNTDYLYTVFQPKAKKSASGKKKGGSAKKKGKSKGKSKGKKSASAAGERTQPVPDPLSYAAMKNAYYISHGPVQFLEFRGYSWSGGGAGKKGGRKKK